MNENEPNEAIVDLDESNEEGVEETPEPKVEKPKRTPEEELDYFEGRANRLRKKLGKDTPEKSSEKFTEKPSDLDYGQKAFLRSYDIKGPDELQLAKDWTKRTGDSLDVMVEDDIFLAKLSGLREAKASANAIPKGTKRSSIPARDDLSVALAEYEQTGKMPENRTLREQVLDAKIEREKGAFR